MRHQHGEGQTCRLRERQRMEDPDTTFKAIRTQSHETGKKACSQWPNAGQLVQDGETSGCLETANPGHDDVMHVNSVRELSCQANCQSSCPPCSTSLRPFLKSGFRRTGGPCLAGL